MSLVKIILRTLTEADKSAEKFVKAEPEWGPLSVWGDAKETYKKGYQDGVLEVVNSILTHSKEAIMLDRDLSFEELQKIKDNGQQLSMDI